MSDFALSYCFFSLVALCVGQRCVELLISYRNRKSLSEQGFDSCESSSALTQMVALHVGWFVAILLESLLVPSILPAPLREFALMGFLLAQGLRIWVIRALGMHWNIGVMGKGGGADFVARGPYAFIRHPNYLAVIVEILTLPLIGGAWRTALVFSVLNALLLRRRIALEERQLFLRPGYAEVMGSKPRIVWGLW